MVVTRHLKSRCVLFWLRIALAVRTVTTGVLTEVEVTADYEAAFPRRPGERRLSHARSGWDSNPHGSYP